MDEAMNDLAFIATGLYGKPIPKQNGAPLRLVAPWKYGFKNVKSIVSIEFTDKRPGHLLGEAAVERVRLLGQREPAGGASALEPGDREAAGQRRARPDPALQRLRRVRGRAVRRPQSGKALHVMCRPPLPRRGGPRYNGRRPVRPREEFCEIQSSCRAVPASPLSGRRPSEGGVRAGVSQQADQDRRALRRRQRHRPHGARPRRQAAGDPEAADHRRRQARAPAASSAPRPSRPRRPTATRC